MMRVTSSLDPGSGCGRAASAALNLCIGLACIAGLTAGASAQSFDHDYRGYAVLLRAHLDGPRVDYARLKARRDELDRVVAEFGHVSATDERSWSRANRLAFWINAYNVFTLRAVVDHYPIQNRMLTLAPRDSIRQIDGVWTTLRWKAAGREVTLDEIEHTILRKEIGGEPRIHFAVNCASVSCPPLLDEPYRGASIDAQLERAARAYLASSHGVRIEGSRLLVSSLFKWYGDDFVPSFAGRHSANVARMTPAERAILGLLATYGSEEIKAFIGRGPTRIAYLDYDWSLNDVRSRTP